MCNVQAVGNLLAQEKTDFSEIREALKDIEAGAKRGGAVVHHLRGLYAKTPQIKAALQVNDILEQTIGLLRSELVLKKTTVQLELDPNLRLIRGSRVELQQVVLNLVTNALEAMTACENGARLLYIRTAFDEPATIRASFRDCGTGLTEEQLRHMFEPLRTTKVGGMGMGLTICLAIIEGHGGRLWAENNPECGSTFHFTLPAFSSGPS